MQESYFRAIVSLTMKPKNQQINHPFPDKHHGNYLVGKRTTIQKNKWKDVTFDMGFKASYQLINNEILVVQGKGYSGLEDEKQAVLFGNAIILNHLPHDQKYVMVQDWKHYENSSSEARQYFIDALVTSRRLKAIVFCNTTWTQAMSIKIAARLKVLKMTVYICPSLSVAIDYAEKIMADLPVKHLKDNPSRSLFSIPEWIRKKRYKNLIQDLLEYIEAIDWQSGKFIKPYTIDSRHVMLPVFDAITFIKSQLDMTFQDRNKIEQQLTLHKANLEKIVTQRTRDLEASKRHFKQLLEYSPISTAILENDYHLSFINQKFTNTFGWDLDEINSPLKMASIIFQTPGNRQKRFKAWADSIFLSRGETRDFGIQEKKVLCKDGSHCVVEISVNCIDDRILILINDITKRKKAEAKLAELAIRDELTGLYNRRYFMETLEVEFQRSSRYNLPLSMIFIDVDHFKQVNDTHGHPGGDSLLKGLADIFQKNFRNLDTIFRIGGEEFAVIFPETSIVQALKAAVRLKTTVEKTSFKIEGKTIWITISIGLSMVSETINSKGMFMKLVDDALYLAKKRGRNRIECL